MDIEKCKKIFGERIQDIRKDKGIIQMELSELLGVSREMLSNYERGQNVMPDDIKLKFAKHFNVSLDYLIGAIDDEIPLVRENRIDLPKGFPPEEKAKVQDYIRLIVDANKHRSEKQ